MGNRIENVLGARTVRQIRYVIVARVAVQVSDLIPAGSFSQEGQRDESVHILAPPLVDAYLQMAVAIAPEWLQWPSGR